MKFTMQIESENAAFEPDAEGINEVARIVSQLANDLCEGRTQGALLDVNGNRVGSFEVTL